MSTPTVTVPTFPQSAGVVDPNKIYYLPSWPWTISVAFVKVMWLSLFLVLLPIQIESTLLPTLPITTNTPFGLLLIVGGAIAVISGLRTLTKPTKYYGQVCFAGSITKLIWLLVLAGTAGVYISINAGSSAFIVFGFSLQGLYYMLMIVPAIAACAGLVIAYEDYKHPKERLPYDFPVKLKN